MKIQERERITEGRCFKLIISLAGIFMTSWSLGKKEIRSIAKRLGLISRRAISSSEKGGELHTHAFGWVCSWW